jgi:hypothetical protein
MGALHPVLFFTLIYGISLFLAIFVCRTVYYSVNGDQDMASATTTEKPMDISATQISATAYNQ